MEINEILDEREGTHGDFMVKAAFIQEFKNNVRKLGVWDKLESDQQEALDMIVMKMSRIIYGNPNHVDHWQDIVGYAQLVINRLND